MSHQKNHWECVTKQEQFLQQYLQSFRPFYCTFLPSCCCSVVLAIFFLVTDVAHNWCKISLKSHNQTFSYTIPKSSYLYPPTRTFHHRFCSSTQQLFCCPFQLQTFCHVWAVVIEYSDQLTLLTSLASTWNRIKSSMKACYESTSTIVTNLLPKCST